MWTPTVGLMMVSGKCLLEQSPPPVSSPRASLRQSEVRKPRVRIEASLTDELSAGGPLRAMRKEPRPRLGAFESHEGRGQGQGWGPLECHEEGTKAKVGASGGLRQETP